MSTLNLDRKINVDGQLFLGSNKEGQTKWNKCLNSDLDECGLYLDSVLAVERNTVFDLDKEKLNSIGTLCLRSRNWRQIRFARIFSPLSVSHQLMKSRQFLTIQALKLECVFRDICDLLYGKMSIKNVMLG